MKRRTRDRRQGELLLPIIGNVPSGAAWAEGSWQCRLVAVISKAAAVYGKAQVAVWAAVDQRTVENWIAGRNLPSLEATVSLARNFAPARSTIELAMDELLERGVA